MGAPAVQTGSGEVRAVSGRPLVQDPRGIRPNLSPERFVYSLFTTREGV